MVGCTTLFPSESSAGARAWCRANRADVRLRPSVAGGPVLLSVEVSWGREISVVTLEQVEAKLVVLAERLELRRPP
jgi:hypothetical protein